MRPTAFLTALLLVVSARAADPAPFPPDSFPVKVDWSWVKSAVFVPTNCVNDAQQWDEYDPAITDRELHYAAFYGFNCVRVFLQYAIYLKKRDALLHDIDDFLSRADSYGLKTEFIFFDDCFQQPDPNLFSPNYHYPPPVFGVHNSRWWSSPGAQVKRQFDANAGRLKAYVQDIVKAHKADPRVIFWETFNEPNKSPETQRLMEAALGWIHETGTAIPVTATGGSFSGGPYSDFLTWHDYTKSYGAGYDLHSLCTECMQRRTASLPAVVSHMGGRVGFTVWELGIGRDNCRFDWDDNAKHPARNEPAAPFHGVVYPDGHPWSIDDVKSLMGPAALDRAPVFDVRYYRDDHFSDVAKTSITPMIDFDLTDEPGAGSPDASAGIPNEHFSVLWTGMLLPPAKGSYTFFADCDSQVKVTVDGKPVLDKETPGRSEVSHTIDLAAQRPCAMRVEYRHFSGNSSVHLSWSGPGMDKRIVLPVKGP